MKSYVWEVIETVQDGVTRSWAFGTYQAALDHLAKMAGLPSSAWGPAFVVESETPRKTVNVVCAGETPNPTLLVCHH